MSDFENNGTILNVKRVRRATDKKGREQIVLTFGLGNTPNGTPVNGADQLIASLAEYAGKQINFDVRLDKKTGPSGAEFDTGFVIVKEMIPKDDPRNTQAKTKFVPKGQTRTAELAKNADRVRQAIKE